VVSIDNISLYKYVIADRIDILKNGFIRFTQPDALNDPWEMRPCVEKIIEDDDEIKDLIVKDIIKQVSELGWVQLNPGQKLKFQSYEAFKFFITYLLDKNCPTEYSGLGCQDIN
jgi:hypothetical protein